MSARIRIGMVAVLGAAASLLLVAAFLQAFGAPLGSGTVRPHSGNPDDATYVPLTGISVDDAGEDGGFSPAADDEGGLISTEKSAPTHEPAPWPLPMQWPSYPPLEDPYDSAPYRNAPVDRPSDAGPIRSSPIPPDGGEAGGDPAVPSAPPLQPTPVEPTPAPDGPGAPPAEAPVDQAPDPAEAPPPAESGDGTVGGNNGGSEPAPAVPPSTDPVDGEPAPDQGSTLDEPAPPPPSTDVIEGIEPPPADLVPEPVNGPESNPPGQITD